MTILEADGRCFLNDDVLNRRAVFVDLLVCLCILLTKDLFFFSPFFCHVMTTGTDFPLFTPLRV